MDVEKDLILIETRLIRIIRTNFKSNQYSELKFILGPLKFQFSQLVLFNLKG